jgi:protein-L-isoaspartate O-methyltransferase
MKRLRLPVFVAAIFLSAFLLFAVEPMFTKMVLPTLGGAPAVWSVAMVFFQTLMLAGYAYAHWLTSRLPLRAALLTHLAVLAIASVSLPIALRADALPPLDANPMLWLIGAFGLSVGLPFFALAAQGPLLQAWFARSGHQHADNPYFLYGASNIGSFAALLAYPFVIEPFFGLKAQSTAWTLGYAAMVVCVAAAAALVASGARRNGLSATEASPARVEKTTLSTRLAWVGLSFVPSALLVAVTAHISTDIAAAPLLWVLPLALYLLAFVLTVRERPVVGTNLLKLLQSGGTALVLITMAVGGTAIGLSLAAHLGLFLVNALVASAALYALRPQARELTAFYAYMSFGGALGGLFAGLVAPNIFSTILEYPLLLAAAIFCRADVWSALRAMTRGVWIMAAAMALAVCVVARLSTMGLIPSGLAQLVLAASFGIALVLTWREARQMIVIGVAAVFQLVLFQHVLDTGDTHRSFFGVVKITEMMGGQFRVMAHGTTLHGAVRIRQANGAPLPDKPLPTTYYAPQGPMGEAIATARALKGPLSRLSFIGLGVGALACHALPGEAVTYYEIDPLVVRLASDANRFRFLSACTPNAQIITGDARLTLARATQNSDVIVVDAFSSDAIPVHLLTREAMALYLDKLAPGGRIVVHISNKSMAFSQILARAAAEAGLQTFVAAEFTVPPERGELDTGSIAAILVRETADLGTLAAPASRWRKIDVDQTARPWSDDWSTILPAIIAKWRGVL